MAAQSKKARRNELVGFLSHSRNLCGWLGDYLLQRYNSAPFLEALITALAWEERAIIGAGYGHRIFVDPQGLLICEPYEHALPDQFLFAR